MSEGEAAALTLRERLVRVVVLGALLDQLHALLAALLAALLRALLRPPRLLLHHAASAAQRTKKLSLDANSPYRTGAIASALAR